MSRTLRGSFSLQGVGVHRGGPAKVTVRGGACGYQLWCRGASVAITPGCARAVAGATVIEGPTFSVGVVEHLLAALFGLGVYHATLEVEGDEIPILDGSSQPFVDAIDACGTEPAPPIFPIFTPVAIDGAAVTAGPATWGVEVDFGPPPYPSGTLVVPANEAGFRRVAAARTFVRAAEIAAARAAGRGGGATAENTVIYDDTGPWHPERAFADGGPGEAVRHKLLDLVGDLALLGRPISGAVFVRRGSHARHHALLAAVVAANG